MARACRPAARTCSLPASGRSRPDDASIAGGVFDYRGKDRRGSPELSMCLNQGPNGLGTQQGCVSYQHYKCGAGATLDLPSCDHERVPGTQLFPLLDERKTETREGFAQFFGSVPNHQVSAFGAGSEGRPHQVLPQGSPCHMVQQLGMLGFEARRFSCREQQHGKRLLSHGSSSDPSDDCLTGLQFLLIPGGALQAGGDRLASYFLVPCG